MFLVTADLSRHTVVVRQLQHCIQMPHLSMRRWTWLLLLLLYLALTVQLSVGGRRIRSHVSDTNSQRTAVSEDVILEERPVPLSGKSEDAHQLLFVATGGITVTATARPTQKVKTPARRMTKEKKSRSPTKAQSSTAQKQNPKPSEAQKMLATTATAKTLMQRIERASSPSLYDQMRSKLQSLGAAVTEEQLSVAATKCGGQEPTLHYVQSYDFVRSAEHLCSGELLALVAVHSNAKNFERRATIRRTWGSLRYVGQFRIEVAFFLGLPASGDSDESGATGAQLRARIGAESDRFGDIVQLGFTENYRNLTIKHLGVYEWLLRHCRSAQYLVKVDDDTFTDVAHLATFLSKVAPPGLYCTATQGSKPFRVPVGENAKWVVTKQEYSQSSYPTYCEGFAYALPTKHVADLYLCSLFKKFFWIDDVHITGTLATSMGVSVTRFWRGHGYTVLVPSLASETIMDYIFLTAYNSEFFAGLWAKLWQAVLRYSLDNAL